MRSVTNRQVIGAVASAAIVFLNATRVTCAAPASTELTTAPTTAPATDFAALFASHPAAETLKTFFDGGPHGNFVAGRSTRADYLPLIAGNVDYWKHFQDDRGAIVDPFERKERQYSTPAFALAAATLIAADGRKDLLEPATRAMSWSLSCLANHKTADGHADFYIPLVMHAYRILSHRVDAGTRATWDEQLRSLIPAKTYTAAKPGGNWNLVNVAGEAMRRKDGFVAGDQTERQRDYIDRSIGTQLKSFTPLGMYVDPNAPLAYDAFPRLWLEDMLADGAYDDGEHRAELERTLSLGGLSTLLLVSPSGEWASGGRSAHHQWNEAEVAVIGEIEASRWQHAGRADIAGAFKRAAHLSRESMARWQRGSGEFWIVKNFADPGRRFGFMGYSFNSQYNLLAAAMLSIAHERADDTIAETPLPSEAAAYVFDVRDAFHHVAAAAGGYYVWIDTAADPDHGSTGLQRVHRAGVALSPLTDTPSPHQGQGPADEPTRLAMSPGIEWNDRDGVWRSLAAYGTRRPAPTTQTTAPTSQATTRPRADGDDRAVGTADLQLGEHTNGRVAFTIHYTLAGGDGAPRTVDERYTISADGVEGATHVDGAGPFRVVFPALVNDGARDTDVTVDSATLTIARLGAPDQQPVSAKAASPKPGGTLVWKVLAPAGLTLARTGPQVVTHNGYVQAVSAELPPEVSEVTWKLTLAPNPVK